MPTESKCGKPAAMRVFWPGREPLLMCEKHAEMARNVASAMGMHLSMDPISEGECTNMVVSR